MTTPLSSNDIHVYSNVGILKGPQVGVGSLLQKCVLATPRLDVLMI